MEGRKLAIGWSTFFILMFSVMAICSHYSNKKKNTPPPTARFENVKRVFMHEPGRYSILMSDEEGHLHIHTLEKSYFAEISIIADVPADHDMWVDVGSKQTDPWCGRPFIGFCTWKRTAIIHVHSAKELNGAGWDHGKFGKGTTTVIQ